MEPFAPGMKEYVRHKARNNMPKATYTKAHEYHDHIDNYINYDYQNYALNFDFDNVPYKAQIDNALNSYTDSSYNQVINFNPKYYEDEFSTQLQDYCTNQLGLFEREVQMFNQPKNSISGNHVDHHVRIRNNNGLLDLLTEDIMFDHIYRYWIPLTDRKHGQFFEINGHQILDWKAGEVYRLYPKHPHCGCNIGEDIRVFVIITGYKEPVEQLKQKLS